MRRLFSLMWLGFFWLIAIGCSGERPKEEPARLTSEEKMTALRADVDAAIKLLEEEKYPEFLERYMPAETLSEKPEMLSMPLAVVAIQTQIPEFFPEMLEQLRSLNKEEIEFLNDEQTVAQIGRSRQPSRSSRTNPLPDPTEESIPVLEGFEGDLNEVLAQAVATLEAGNHQEFIEKMYPQAELLAATSDPGMPNLLARLKEHPQMVEQMISDLKALQQLTPEYHEQQSVATYQVPRDKQPSRNFRLEKQGTWRLANTSQAVRSEMHRQAGLPSPGLRELPGAWVWTGDHWRLAGTLPAKEEE